MFHEIRISNIKTSDEQPIKVLYCDAAGDGRRTRYHTDHVRDEVFRNLMGIFTYPAI